MGKATSNRARVSVLLSGGLDSTACLAFYFGQGFAVEGLFIDYGQAAASREEAAAEAVSRHYGVQLQSIRCHGLHPPVLVEVRGRNAFLLMGALMAVRADAGVIGIGVHAGTIYADCSEEFINQCQRLFDHYVSGRIRIGAPFISWSKQQVWEYCREAHVPIDLTYSCELGREQPCGRCLSCKDLVALHAC